MTLVESIIVTLVIGLTVTVGLIAIIQKIFDEKRKDNEHAAKKLIAVINEVPKMMTSVVKNLEQQKTEQIQKTEKKELDKEMERMFAEANSD